MWLVAGYLVLLCVLMIIATLIRKGSKDIAEAETVRTTPEIAKRTQPHRR